MAHHATEIHFEQSLEAVHQQLQRSLVFAKHPEYRIALFVASHPEEIHQFRIVWKDDRGQLQMHRGFCVNYSTTLGDLHGPIRFETTVNLDIIRFLGWEQLLKSAYLFDGEQSLRPVCVQAWFAVVSDVFVTHQGWAGAFAAGADFDPSGKSDNEVVRFCNAFMTQISKNSPIMPESIMAEIGISEDILSQCRSSLRGGEAKYPPVSRKSAITDAEANAISLVCYTEMMLSNVEDSQGKLRNQAIAISGSGKLAIATALRALEVGAKVLSLSDRSGSIVRQTGFTIDQVTAVHAGKLNQLSLASTMRPMVASGEVRYYPRERPWQRVQGATVALPCAVEMEIDLMDARTLVGRGVRYVLEGSTMSCTQAAVDAFERCHLQGQPKVWYAPSKVTTAAGLGVCVQMRSLAAYSHSRHKEQWVERLTEATRTNFSGALSAMVEYTEGLDVQTPELNLGSCILAVTRLANTMKQHGIY